MKSKKSNVQSCLCLLIATVVAPLGHAQQPAYADVSGSALRSAEEFYVRSRLSLEGADPVRVDTRPWSRIWSNFMAPSRPDPTGELDRRGLRFRWVAIRVWGHGGSYEDCDVVIGEPTRGSAPGVAAGFVMVWLEGHTCIVPGVGFPRLIRALPPQTHPG